MRRPTSRWVPAVVAAGTYAALWWAAVFGAAQWAFRNIDPDEEISDRIAEGIWATLEFAIVAMLGLIVAHVIWAALLGWLLPTTSIGGRYVGVLAIVVVANLSAPFVMGSLGNRLALVALTFVVPAGATWWAAGDGRRDHVADVSS